MFLLGIALYPCIQYVQTPIYCGAVLSTILSSIAATICELRAGPYINFPSVKEREAHVRWLERRAWMFQPMHRKYMLLNSIQLFDDFAGILLKLRYHFFGLFRTLHRIGNNTVLVLILLSSVSATSVSKMWRNFPIRSPLPLFNGVVDFNVENRLFNECCGRQHHIDHLFCMTDIHPSMVLAGDGEDEPV